MRLQVLGCSGGIGGDRRTTSFLVDEDLLIDAGTGVGELSLDQMSRLRHIFLTHSHLDHIAGLPLLADTLFGRLDRPLQVYAQTSTLEVLRSDIFNWRVWPDFTRLPDEAHGILRFNELPVGARLEVDGRRIESIPVEHTVPAVAYRISEGETAVCFSGDTTTNDGLWQALNAHERLDLLLVECAFADDDLELSRLSKHYCPQLLAEDLAKLKHRPEVRLSHFKPGDEDTILEQCRARVPEMDVRGMSGGEVFEL
jgi:ribonuclease BN (tRNA processing enzyme)